MTKRKKSEKAEKAIDILEEIKKILRAEVAKEFDKSAREEAWKQYFPIAEAMLAVFKEMGLSVEECLAVIEFMRLIVITNYVYLAVIEPLKGNKPVTYFR